MTTSGPTVCGTGTNYNDGGNVAWTAPALIEEDDGAITTSNLNNGQTSQMLKATNFGFTIPEGASVTDVSFSYQRRSNSTNRTREHTVAMLDAGGSAGTNKADTSTYWATSDETRTLNGDGTYWGITLTPTLCNDADFGIEIKVSSSSGSSIACIDYVSCTVTYTETEGGGLLTSSVLVRGGILLHGILGR